MTTHKFLGPIMAILFAFSSISAIAAPLPAPPACGASADFKNAPRLPEINTGTAATPAQLEAASKALMQPGTSSPCTQQEKSIYHVVSGICHVASVKTERGDTSETNQELTHNCTTFYNHWVDANQQ